jgi:hypothetical protein
VLSTILSRLTRGYRDNVTPSIVFHCFCSRVSFTYSTGASGLHRQSSSRSQLLSLIWPGYRTRCARWSWRYPRSRPDVSASYTIVTCWEASDKFSRYDYIVIDGGTAGNAISVRLASRSQSSKLEIFYEIGKLMLGSTPTGAFFGIENSFIDAVPVVDWQFRRSPRLARTIAGCIMLETSPWVAHQL